MRRAAALIALLATACTTMEPKYARPSPAIPADMVRTLLLKVPAWGRNSG